MVSAALNRLAIQKPHFHTYDWWLSIRAIDIEEAVGFEPTDRVSSISGFQGRRNKPLCHASRTMMVDHASTFLPIANENAGNHHSATFCLGGCAIHSDFTEAFDTSVV